MRLFVNTGISSDSQCDVTIRKNLPIWIQGKTPPYYISHTQVLNKNANYLEVKSKKRRSETTQEKRAVGDSSAAHRITWEAF